MRECGRRAWRLAGLSSALAFLDMVRLQNSCLAYEVDRNKEFAPVKNKEGADSADTARKLLAQNGVKL